MIKPNLFIVGQTRSGTTSLKEYLNSHPDVFIYHAGKGFFGYGKSDIQNEDEYCQLFENAVNKKIVGEKCSDYLACPVTAEKIKKFSPDSKIIIILRNPIDMMYSLHNWEYNIETFETLSNFEDALAIEEKRKEERLQDPEKYHPHVFYRELADYETQVNRYFENFGTENVKIIILEEFVKNPEKTFSEVLDFLELDHPEKTDFTQHNANRMPRSRFLQRLMKNDSSTLVKAVKKLPNAAKIYSKINLPEQERINLEPSLRKKLKNEFKPKIKKLSELLNIDLSVWDKP